MVQLSKSIIALPHPCFIQGMLPVNHRIVLCSKGIDHAPKGLQEDGFTLSGTAALYEIIPASESEMSRTKAPRRITPEKQALAWKYCE